MSKSVDERVVSMRFDNGQFEKNVQTSLGTIDKLKQSLNFKGAVKGLDDISASAKKCDMSGLSSGIETVKAKFSALEVMGVTALVNITNSAVNAGKRLASAFTIDPIKSGFQEYETQINAVQTILANTSAKGTTLDQVNDALDELNHYADMTIYNFTEMTRNIGTFTAAGVDLETSVSAIQGIANLAAVSGSTSQQASTAMYQLSQALAAGTVKLMDWNSVVNAGMGGEIFQNALKETSEALGTGAAAAIKAEGSFRESLSTGWLTSKVLTETLKKFTTSGANEYVAEYTGLSVEAVEAALKSAEAQYGEADAIEHASKALAEKSGKNADEIADALQFAKTAEDAATKVKTFSQLMDTLKEAAQSGWTQTWEILIGDFEEAKELFTELSDYFGDLINESAESRNNMLEGAMNSKWNQLGDQLEDAGIKTKDLSADMFKLSEEQLKNKGFTEKQIKVIQTLKKQCDETGMSVDEMIENMNRPSGRELLIDSFRNIIYGIVDAIKAVKKAWTDIFPPITSGQLYTAIEGFHSLTEHLKVNDETADKITRTFKGLFSILKIFTTLVSGGLSLAIKAVSAVLSVFDLDILDATAAIGDFLVKVKEIIVDNNLLVKGIKIVATAIKEFVEALLKVPAVQKAIASIKDAFGNLKDRFSNFSSEITKFADALKDLDKLSLDDLKNLFTNMADSVKSWFKDTVGGVDNVKTSLVKFKDTAVSNLETAGQKFEWIKEKIAVVVDWIKEKLPAAIAIGMGVATILAVKKLASALEVLGKPIQLLENLVKGVTKVFDSFADSITRNAKAKAFKTRAEGIKTLAVAIGILAASVYALSKIDSADLWESVAAITALTTVLSAATIAVSKLSGSGLGAAKGSGSILALSASMLILVQALKNMQDLDSSKFLANITAMVVMMGSLATVAGLLGKFAPTLSTGSFALIALAASIKIMVSALKDIDNADFNNIGESLLLLIGIVGTMGVLAKTCANISFSSGVGMIAAIVSLKLLISAFKSLENVDLSKAGENLFSFIAIFSTFILVIKATEKAGQYAIKAGVGILAMSAALLLITLTIKQLGKINKTDLQKATDAVAGLLVVFGAVVALSYFAGANAAKAGVMLLTMSGAMLILTGAIAILKNMSPDGLDQALDVIQQIAAIFGALIIVTKFAGADISKNLITMTVAVGVFAALVAALTLLDQSKVQSATACLSALMGMFALLIASTKLINTAKGVFAKTLGTLTVLLGVVVALSGVLVILSSLDVQNTLEVAASLSVLLLSLSASCAVLSMANGVLPTALTAVGIMTAVVAGLAIIIGSLSQFTNGDEAIKIAASLSILLVSMTAVCAALTLVGAAVPAALAGALALDGVIVIVGGLVLGLGALFDKFEGLEGKLDTGIRILNKVGEGLGGFFGGIVNGFNEAATANLEEIGTRLGNFMTNAMPFFDNVGSLTADKLTGVQTLASIVKQLAGMNIKESLASWATGEDSITVFTSQISQLGDGLATFSSKVTGEGVNLSAIDTAATASKKLVDIAANITPFTTDMPTFKTDLIAFGDAIVAFSNKVTGGEGGAAVNSEAVEAAANAGKLLTEVANAIPKQGLLQDVMGKQDLADFGEKIKAFGESIISFSETVTGLDENAASNIQRSTNAGMALTEVANAIPKQGLLQELMGKQDIADFGAKIVAFGSAIKAYAAEVVSLDEGAAENISRSAKAGLALSEVANSIPKQDGVMQAILGQQEIAQFGSSLITFGKGITSYAAEAAKITDDDIEAINRSKDAVKAILDVADAIPKEGGIGALFGGDENVGGFATGVLTLASAIKNYVSVANSITEDDIDAIKNSKDAVKELGDVSESAASDFGEIDIGPVNTAISVMRSLVNFATGLAERDYSGVTTFKAAIEDLGNISLDKITSAFDASKLESIKTFATTLGQIGADAVNNFANAITNNSASVQQAGMNLMGKLRDGISASKGTVNGAISTVLSSLSLAVTNKGATFESAGRSIIARLVSGLSKASGSIKTALGTVLESAVAKIEGYHSEFYSAGSYIIEGLADGIDGSAYIAADAARAAAKEALNAAKEALGMNSPSKEFMEVGKYSCLGLMLGLENYTSKVYKSGAYVGQQVSQGIRDRLGINSPAKDGQESGSYEGEGVIQGLKSKASALYESGKSAASNVSNGLKSFGAKATAYNEGENTAQGFLDGISTILASDDEGSSAAEKSGSKVVDGVASGISKNTSAETAAANKADSINKTFESRLSLLSVMLENAQKEFELWQNTEGVNASESESAAKEAESLEKQVSIQSERVEIASQQYQQTLAQFGETAQETQEAYNTLLEEKIKSAQLATQLSEATTSQLNASKSEYSTYISWLKANAEDLSALGLSSSDINDIYNGKTVSLSKINTSNSSGGGSNTYIKGRAKMLAAGLDPDKHTISQVTRYAKGITSIYADSATKSATKAGKNVSSGLASGISSGSSTVAKASTKVASTAVSSIKSTLKTHSPSRVTFEIGKYVVEGLTNGLVSYATTVDESAENLGNRAVNGLSTAISKVKTLVENGMDTQPTIRPVLDLSDVQSGADSINGMFSMTPSVGLLSDVGSINTMMNARNQNGVNSDVVSAIEDLGRKFGGYSGDTYTINGVTYDDGSNISEAVKTLVRAARVERRR